MEELGKPFLRIATIHRPNGKQEKYLSVAVKTDAGKRMKTIRSFGSVMVAENWDRAIEFTLDELKAWYRTEKAKYVGSR